MGKGGEGLVGRDIKTQVNLTETCTWKRKKKQKLTTHIENPRGRERWKRIECLGFLPL